MVGSLGRLTLIGGNGFRGKFGVVVCCIIDGTILEIGIVGRLIVVGITFPTFNMCPLLPFVVFIILSAIPFVIAPCVDIARELLLHPFTTPFVPLVSAIVKIARPFDVVPILFGLSIAILLPFTCCVPLMMPLAIFVNLVLRLPFTIGSGT